MKKDKILYIKINKEGQMHIKPESSEFHMIYRSASGVHWNNDSKTLYTAKPKDWSYFDWYKHIMAIAQGDNYCKLEITAETEWINISNDLKKEIQRFY